MIKFYVTLKNVMIILFLGELLNNSLGDRNNSDVKSAVSLGKSMLVPIKKIKGTVNYKF